MNELEQKKVDAYDWICKAIMSSHNDFHFEGLDNLIMLFHQNFNDDSLKTELEHLRIKKWNEIHHIL
jgi:hypothetical protein